MHTLVALLSLTGSAQESAVLEPVSEPETRLEGDNRRCHVHEAELPQTPSPQALPRTGGPPCFGSTPKRHIRVNFHYVQRSANHPDGPGNFTRDGDGLGGSYTAYEHAQDIIDMANAQIAENEGLWLVSASPYTPVDFGFDVVLNGVFFVQDDFEYANNHPFSGFNKVHYDEDGTRVVNVIMHQALHPSYDGMCKGVATSHGLPLDGLPMFKVQDSWTEYQTHGGPTDWCTVKTFLHELGHLLDLYHTTNNLRDPQTGWVYAMNPGDSCADTPLHPDCWENDVPNLGQCDEWGVEISNNLMDYNSWATWSLSDCQLAQAHAELDGDMSGFVEQCTDCAPAHAFFDLEPDQCLPIRLDGTATDNEDRYFIEVFEVSGVGQGGVIPGTYFGEWFTGQIGNIEDLGLFLGYPFQAGRTYRVKVAAQSDDEGLGNGTCTAWDEQVRYVTTSTNCVSAWPGDSCHYSLNSDFCDNLGTSHYSVVELDTSCDAFVEDVIWSAPDVTTYDVGGSLGVLGGTEDYDVSAVIVFTNGTTHEVSSTFESCADVSGPL